MATASIGIGVRRADAQQVPYSSGTEPANACDCHMHIYDAKSCSCIVRIFGSRSIPAYGKGYSMIYERWRWYFFALACSIVLAIAVAYLFERRCQNELAFQRAYPEALSELIVGSQPVKCWLDN